MSERTVTIDSFAAITKNGLLSPTGLRTWDSDSCDPAEIQRAHVLSKPYPGFGKLVISDRLAFSAAALLLSSYPEHPGDTTAICLALPFGSLSTDLRYNESVVGHTPSPSLFSATLPSSAISDIAIYYKLKGPNRTFAAGLSDDITAIEEAARLVSDGVVPAALALYVTAVESVDTKCSHIRQASSPFTGNAAYALLLRSGRGVQTDTSCSMSLSPDRNDAFRSCAREYFPLLIDALQAGNPTEIQVQSPGYQGSIRLTRGA